MHTGTNAIDNSELLFLRLKKRTKFVSCSIQTNSISKQVKGSNPVETREGETLFENVINELMNGILNDKEMDNLLDNCSSTPGGIFNQIVTSNEKPPSAENLYFDLPVDTKADACSMVEQKVYTENLKELTGNDEEDILRKNCFLEKKFSNMLEYMMEDTIFNLMEEATFEEFDLMQAPKIYIRKEQAGK